MSENRILIIAIPPRRSSEERSNPRGICEGEPGKPAEVRELTEAETLIKERLARIGCEPVNNTPPKRRL